MIQIENLTFSNEMKPINLSCKDFGLKELNINKESTSFLWKYFNNEAKPLLGDVFFNKSSYNEIKKEEIVSFNYENIVLINDSIFFNKNLSVSSFLYNYLNFFSIKFDKNKLSNEFLEKLNNFNLSKKISKLTPIELSFVYIIIFYFLKNKFVFIYTDEFSEESKHFWKTFESKLNDICYKNEIIIIKIDSSINEETKDDGVLLIYENKKFDSVFYNKKFLFFKIYKILKYKFYWINILVPILFGIFLLSSLLLSYNYSKTYPIDIKYVFIYVFLVLCILTILFYIFYVSWNMNKYKRFIYNFQLSKTNKIIYLCIYFWSKIIQVILVTNLINIFINLGIHRAIVFSNWNSSFSISLGLLIFCILIVSVWIPFFYYNIYLQNIFNKIKEKLCLIIKKWQTKNNQDSTN